MALRGTVLLGTEPLLQFPIAVLLQFILSVLFILSKSFRGQRAGAPSYRLFGSSISPIS